MSLVRDFNDKTGQAHVDIKPSNLCTSPNGRDLFLIDFGYSTSPSTKLPGQTGTPLFMACNLQTIGATCNHFPCTTTKANKNNRSTTPRRLRVYWIRVDVSNQWR